MEKIVDFLFYHRKGLTFTQLKGMLGYKRDDLMDNLAKLEIKKIIVKRINNNIRTYFINESLRLRGLPYILEEVKK